MFALPAHSSWDYKGFLTMNIPTPDTMEDIHNEMPLGLAVYRCDHVLANPNTQRLHCTPVVYVPSEQFKNAINRHYGDVTTLQGVVIYRDGARAENIRVKITLLHHLPTDRKLEIKLYLPGVEWAIVLASSVMEVYLRSLSLLMAGNQSVKPLLALPAPAAMAQAAE